MLQFYSMAGECRIVNIRPDTGSDRISGTSLFARPQGFDTSHTVHRSESSLLSMCCTQFFCLSHIVYISILFSFTISRTLALVLCSLLFSSMVAFQMLLIARYPISAVSTSLTRISLQSMSRFYQLLFQIES